MIVMKGTGLAKSYLEEISSRVKHHTDRGLRKPSLSIILVGEDPASVSYVGLKLNKAKSIGIDAELIKFDKSISEERLSDQVHKLSLDDAVDGILVQLPLPDHIRITSILDNIDSDKDVDGFHPLNTGMMSISKEYEQQAIAACTPKGIIAMMDHYQLNLDGSVVAVVGTGLVTGRPMIGMLINRGATVLIANHHTRDLSSITKNADIVISATGVQGLIKAEHIKEGCYLFDVGIHKDSLTGKLRGDVDQDSVSQKCAGLTPVPGGVGPMTVAMVMVNLWQSYAKRFNIDKPEIAASSSDSGKTTGSATGAGTD